MHKQSRLGVVGGVLVAAPFEGCVSRLPDDQDAASSVE